MKILGYFIIILAFQSCDIFTWYNEINPERFCDELDTAKLFELNKGFEIVSSTKTHKIDKPDHLYSTLDLENETWYSSDTISFENYQYAYNTLSSTVIRSGSVKHVSTNIKPTEYKGNYFRQFYEIEGGLMILSRGAFKSFIHIQKLNGCTYSAYVIILKGKEFYNGDDVS